MLCFIRKVLVLCVLVISVVNCGGLDQVRRGEYGDSEEQIMKGSVKCFLDVLQEDTFKDSSAMRGDKNGAAMEEGFDHQCLKAGNARGHERNEEIEWISGNVSLHLLCRNEESMSVYVEQDIARSKVNQSTTVFYLIFVNGKERYQLSYRNRTTISKLSSKSMYELSSFILIKQAHKWKIFSSNKLTVITLVKGFTPGPLKDVHLSPFRVNKFQELDVDLFWRPVEDSVCLYEILANSMNRSRGLFHGRLNVRNSQQPPFKELSITLRNLTFNTHYQVRLYAINEKDLHLEGPIYPLVFDTPSAGEFGIIEDGRNSSLHDDHYNDLHGHYPILIEKSIWTGVLAVGIIIVVVIICLLNVERGRIAKFYYNRRRQNFSAEDPIELQNFSTNLTIYLDGETEVELEHLKIKQVIGQGAFGLVRQAMITIGEREEMVAVKMLRKRANDDDVREFLHEISVMKSVGKHPNIVGLVGHSGSASRSVQKMILIEYCAKGNLLNFLRNEWKRISNKSATVAPLNSFFGNSVENRCYGDIEETLTNRHLLSMACQIAEGMDHLSHNKVVHRDLAARNILVCDGNLVKISDFGLSRDVYQYNMYKKKGSGKLPIKWLAIESLTHQVYTSQSDVWSYGILLYEILTLGSDPYPSTQTNEMLKLLNTGYRMERPDNCSAEIYNKMLDCWKTNPSERPNFRQINQKLSTILEDMTDEEAEIRFQALNNEKMYPSYLLPI